ncbi:endonuclease/exonuclease/phosphatase family protein [Echinicola strongylocentroti]|uniref:Endonuclease/exonuclease/phosphatase family protein n=1 Tax=Echinicola strongylocentroti TaxID=1795355 RepID=A0A2Z4IFS6_9BACT|nr:endonuclease/exonuclease/phosphatase family protein [Echinicola strongylocentroti]AWW29303.1 endonuclease/exonuclease/phosphatase family protein [Echinicola strongylocentroti]
MPNLREFSLVTFNLYNLNLAGHSMYRDYDGWSDEQYENKITWTSYMLHLLQPDIFGFQELWHEDALKEAFERAGLTASYDILCPSHHDGNKIICAGAVKKGLLEGEPEWLETFPEKFILKSAGDDPQTPDISVQISSFSRPVLHFKVKLREDREAVSVFVAHLKSKAPTAIYREGWYRDDYDYYKNHSETLGYTLSTIRRSAEAAALRMIILDKLKHTDLPVIVLGDLNNSQLSDTLNIMTGQPRYLQGLSSGGGDADLYTVATLQEYRSLRDVYYTHIFQNIRESLDHILVSQEFYDNSRKRIWAFDGMEIYNDHLADENHKDTGTNDHGIVKATFKYSPA